MRDVAALWNQLNAIQTLKGQLFQTWQNDAAEYGA